MRYGIYSTAWRTCAWWSDDLSTVLRNANAIPKQPEMGGWAIVLELVDGVAMADAVRLAKPITMYGPSGAYEARGHQLLDRTKLSEISNEVTTGITELALRDLDGFCLFVSLLAGIHAARVMVLMSENLSAVHWVEVGRRLGLYGGERAAV